MTVKSGNYNTPFNLRLRIDRKQPHKAYPFIKSTPVVVSNSWRVDSRRVDPLNLELHGNYSREATGLRSIPFVSSEVKYYAGGYGGVTRYDYTMTVEGVGFGYVLPKCSWLSVSESNIAELTNNAIKGAREELVNLALFIAELSQSTDLIASTATKIAGAASDIRKGKFARAARTLKIKKPLKANRNKTFADNWLEFSYGWAPLVSDIAGLLKHISRGSRSLRIKAKSRLESSVPMYAQATVLQCSAATQEHHFYVDWEYSGTWIRREQVMLVFEPKSAYWDQVSRLGFMDPSTLAWESIPLSFVVDWFANVGDLLGDMNRGLTLEYVTGSYAEHHRNDGLLSGAGFWHEYNTTVYRYLSETSHVDSCRHIDFRFRRTTIPWHQVAVTFMLNAPFSVNKAITSAALVVQRLK